MAVAGNAPKRCFVIAPIGEPDSDIRKRSDAVLEYIIRPILENPPLMYKVVRADEIAQPGLITNQIVEHLRDDDLVVADLTGANPNVIYELAIRHCLKRPVINLLQSEDKIPFDLGNSRTIFYDLTLPGGARCKEELKKHVTAVEREPSNVDSPVSSVIELSATTQKNLRDPNRELLLQIQDQLKTLRHELQDQNAKWFPEIVQPPLGSGKTHFLSSILASELASERDRASATALIEKLESDIARQRGELEVLRMNLIEEKEKKTKK